MISDWDVDPLIIYYEALSFLSITGRFPFPYIGFSILLSIKKETN
jgi:hypothetical protein